MNTRIAIIDDDEDFRLFFSRGLVEEGLDARSFVPDEHLYEALVLFAPHIITFDLNFNSDQTGIDLLRLFENEFVEARKIVISGYLSISATVECMKYNADNVFMKPITPKKFIHMLQSEHVALTPQKNDLQTLEWESIHSVLKKNQFNISKSARELGMNRRTLQRKLKKRPYFL